MRTDDNDRTVHAQTEQMDVVRYGRAGKWYLEPKNPSLPRQAVSIKQAVDYVVWAERSQGTGSVVFYGRRGGLAFDSKVKKILS